MKEFASRRRRLRALLAADVERSSAVSLQSRWRTIFWLALLCIALQQLNFVGLTPPTIGHQATSLPLHLHAGILLAIAIVYRDPRIVICCFVVTFFTWYAHRYNEVHLPLKGALAGFVQMLMNIPWTLLCAKLLGSGRHLSLQRGLSPAEVLRLGWAGLLLFPIGSALIGSVVLEIFGHDVWPDQEMILRHCLGKTFGVLIITFPIVVAWSERYNLNSSVVRRNKSFEIVLLFAATALVFLLNGLLDGYGNQVGFKFRLGPFDVAILLLMLLGWGALRLTSVAAVSFMSASMFLVYVFARTHWAELGYGNLFSLAVFVYEVAALQIAMICLVMFVRNARRANIRLQEEANIDAATGLKNLRGLRHYFNEVEAKLKVQPQQLGYLLLDQVGHAKAIVNIELQVDLAKALAACVSDLARTYQIGSHQYVLMPKDSAPEDIWSEVMRRIERGEIRVENFPFQLLPYIGVAQVFSPTTAVLDAAYLSASVLAMEAREQGDLIPRVAEKGLKGASQPRDETAIDAVEIFSSLRGSGIELYFHKFHSLSEKHKNSMELSGEILCRLRTSDGRLLTPDRFIPFVEAAGRGAELDLAVIRSVFQVLRKHRNSKIKFRDIGINLTGQGIASRSFRDKLWELLSSSPIPLSCLCFEITENATIDNVSAVCEALQRLRAEGCRIAIDDFGTGRQNFSRIKELPFDVVKIDGSFVRNVAAKGGDFALVQASVDIAKAFGAETVAEYVENHEIVEVLRELNVDWAQGHFYSRPQRFAEVFAEN